MHRLLIWCLGAMLLASAFSWATAKSDYDSEAKRRKAEYYYLESQSALNQDEYGKFFVALKRAFELDSADSDIAGEWASLDLEMREDTDSVDFVNDYLRIKKRFYDNPTNYFNGSAFADLAEENLHFNDAALVWMKLDSLFPKRLEPASSLMKIFLKAYLYGDSSAYDKALPYSDRIEKALGKSLESTVPRLQVLYYAGDTIRAMHELQKLAADAEGDYNSLYVLGVFYNSFGQNDSALVYLNKACAIDTTFSNAFVARSQVYLQEGDTARFERDIQTCLNNADLPVDDKAKMMDLYIKEFSADSTYNPAIEKMLDNLEKEYKYELAVFGISGDYYSNKGKYDQALEKYRHIVNAIDPSNVTAWTSSVQMATLTQDTVHAIEFCKEAMTAVPDNLFFPTIASYFLLRLNKPLEAKDVVDSVKIDEIFNEAAVSDFLTTKADVYAAASDTIGALDLYDKAIEINPSNNLALNNAAYFIALTDGDLDKALKYSRKSLEKNELNTTFLDTYAWVLYKKKDFAMARTYIDMALNDPENLSADVYDHAGDIYFMNGEKDKAIEFWEKAHELDPENKIIAKKVEFKTIF